MLGQFGCDSRICFRRPCWSARTTICGPSALDDTTVDLLFRLHQTKSAAREQTIHLPESTDCRSQDQAKFHYVYIYIVFLCVCFLSYSEYPENHPIIQSTCQLRKTKIHMKEFLEARRLQMLDEQGKCGLRQTLVQQHCQDGDCMMPWGVGFQMSQSIFCISFTHFRNSSFSQLPACKAPRRPHPSPSSWFAVGWRDRSSIVVSFPPKEFVKEWLVGSKSIAVEGCWRIALN